MSVSVIIANYNNAKYLSECLSSIVNQTYNDLEIIIVDDCSTDNSMEIIDRFASADSRIKVIQFEKNSGSPSLDRNVAMKIATGEFITFLDADDVMHPTAIEGMMLVQDATNADLVAGKYTKVPEHFYIPENAIIPPPEFEFEAFRRTINLVEAMEGISLVVVWGKLIRRTILQNMEFRTDIYPHEDVEFMMRLYARVDVGAVTNNMTVYYRWSATSVIAKKDRDTSGDVIRVLASFADFTSDYENGSIKYLWFVRLYSFLFLRTYITGRLHRMGYKPDELPLNTKQLCIPDPEHKEKLAACRRQLRSVVRAVRILKPILFNKLRLSRRMRIGLRLFSMGFIETGGKMLFRREQQFDD